MRAAAGAAGAARSGGVPAGRRPPSPVPWRGGRRRV